MNTRPKFSVIIPTLEEEKVLDNTITSIKKSTRNSSQNIEVIVVDGGSKDRTVEIAKKHNCRVFLLKRRGIGKARNFGASHARGDVLVFIDADVIVPDNFFNEIECAFKNSKISGANCNVMPHISVKPSKQEILFYKLWNYIKAIIYHIKPCGTGENGIIIKKELFTKIGGFREDLMNIEDLDFIFRASQKGQFIFLKNLTIYETIRRLRSMGMLRFTMLYISNFFHYIFTKKPRVNEWPVVR